VSVDSKANKNGKKNNYKIRITISLGKNTKTGKNQLQKAGQTWEKIGKQKTSAAAYVSDDLVGHFFVLLKLKELQLQLQ
jgi:hypothetical protein